MDRHNWEDDLLNFDYSNPTPQDDNAIRREEERAAQLREEYERLRQASKAEKQQEAYRQFREEYKGKAPVSKPKKVSGFYKFARFLSIPYVLCLVAFIAILTVMDVLPFFWWAALLVVLGLLSVIIVAQLRKFNIKKWAKVLATFMSIILIVVFGMGSVYALSTMSLLENNSTKNENRVASITKEPFNVCMTGLDVYGVIDEQGRSDVNMVVTVNPETATILMTSVPRDYEVRIPDFDYAVDKLTHTGFYSVDATMHAEEDLLQTQLNYYVKVNFSTVKAFIYSIGGIDVYSDYEFNPVKKPEWTVKKGWNHMDGKQALAFARERKAFEDGDRQRIKNQQAVFEAMIKKGTSSRTMILNYNRIVSNLDQNFEMSFSSREIRSLIKLQLAKNPKWKIYKNSITGGDGHMATYTTGGSECYVMTQDATSIANAQALIQAVLDGKQLDKDEEGNVFIVETNNTESTEDAA